MNCTEFAHRTRHIQGAQESDQVFSLDIFVKLEQKNIS